MAINFTISYTFSPSTTISSSQVNTNFSDEANVWTGLEAKTKSFAALQVDATPSVGADVVRKDYVDGLMPYRRPVLQWASTSAVNMETGINGTSGQARILFPDGNLRTDSTASRINLDITRNAAFSGTAQSGLRSGSASANTWYACYAVKTSDNTSNFVMAADTVLPIQANFTSLNSNFGSNSWVYLGLIRYGDNSGATTSILKFFQAGNITIFQNTATAVQVNAGSGISVASTASAASLAHSYSAGTGNTNTPNNVVFTYYRVTSGTAVLYNVEDSGQNFNYLTYTVASGNTSYLLWISSAGGIIMIPGSNAKMEIWITGFVDGVLGIGSNPLL